MKVRLLLSLGPDFTIFVQYQADVVHYPMRRDLRKSVGLHSSLSIFITISESLKSSHQMKLLVESQHDEIIRALSGCNQFSLCPEVSHHGITALTWTNMILRATRNCMYI